MDRSHLLIAGSIAIDTIETPYDKREQIIGGSTPYAMVAASRYCSTSVVGIIGSDFPDEGHDIYSSYSSNRDDVQTVDGKTFSWGGRYSDNWDDRETLFTDLGVFAEYEPKLSQVNSNVRTALLANIHPSLQRSIIEQCHGEKIILDTMNLWIETTRDELDDVLTQTDILLLNESESELLTGSKEIQTAAIVLLDHGLSTVVIKQGSKGAQLFTSDIHMSIGAYPVETVVDPTGAGDVFAGTFAGVIHSGGRIEEALVQASALASICVEGFGVDKILKSNDEELPHRVEILTGTLEL